MTESGQKVEQQTEKGLEWFLGNVKDCTEFLVVCWAFLMLTVFPVYVIDHYQDIGAYKFAFFSGAGGGAWAGLCRFKAVWREEGEGACGGRTVFLAGYRHARLSSFPYSFLFRKRV